MTEFGLILAINVAGLVFAILLGRWVSARDAGSAEVRRLGSAVSRASETFLRREFRLVGLAVAGLGVLVIAGNVMLARTGRGGGLEAAFWMMLGLLAGAGLSCAAASLASSLAIRASLRMVSAARVSLDRALSIALRAGGAGAVLVECFSFLGLVGVFGLFFAMKGGFAVSGTEAAVLIARVTAFLPTFGFGAAAAALVIQRGGSVFHVASDAGGDLGAEQAAGLPHDDSRNPAIVAELVGDHVGPAVSRSVDVFLMATVANISVAVLSSAIYGATQPLMAGAQALAALPFVIRSFGLVASLSGLMVARTDDAENPLHALRRGQATALVVALGGLLGGCIWLTGAAWPKFFAASALGLCSVALLTQFSQERAMRRSAALREVIDALRVGDAATVTQALAYGLRAAALPIFVLCGALVGAWQLGASTHVAFGGLVCVLAALMAMLSLAPYALALGTFAPIADNACGVLGMNSATATADTQRRTSRLDDAGFGAGSAAQTYLILTGFVGSLVAALAVPALLGRDPAAFAAACLGKPGAQLAGLCGAGVLFAYAGHTLGASTRGARGVALEVERQLRGFPRERGQAQVPKDYTPSYRSCIELCNKSALAGLALPVGVVLLFPALLAVGLRLFYRNVDPAVASEALASYVVVSAMLGLALALVFDATRMLLSMTRRNLRPRGGAVGLSASLSADALGDLLGNAAGPAMILSVKAAALTALWIAPLLG